MAGKRGRSKKVGKNVIRGLIKELPRGGALLDQLVFGVLDELAAETKDKDLNKAIQDIKEQHYDQEGDLARLIVGVEANYDLNQEIKSELRSLSAFLRNRRAAELSDRLVAAFEGALAKKPSTPQDFLRPNTLPRPAVANPGTLLNARYEIVPFMREAREREIDALTVWCDDGAPTAVRLVVGPGGTGKTRLFIEYCRHLRDKGWYAGFLSDQSSSEDVEGLLHTDKPTLAVLDYAECRPQLFDLLKRIAERPEDQTTRVRLVLLAREIADWWHSLLERDEFVRHLLTSSEPVLITPIPLKGPLRQQVWKHAQKGFASFLDKSISETSVDLGDERYGRMLYLHIAALAAVEGLPVHADSVIEDIVRHECHFWTRRYKDQFQEDLDEVDFRRRCARLVAALTLLGGVPTSKAATTLNQRVNGPSQKHILPFLRSLYPGRQGDTGHSYLGGLEPDLLGETLVTSVLTDANNTPINEYLEQVFEHAGQEALRNGFVTLGRISLSHPTESIPWLTYVLEGNIVERARPAFQAALTLGRYTAHSPLGQILARAMEQAGTVDLAVEFESLVPKQTVSLRELAVWATEHLLTWLREKEETEEILIEQARLLNNLGPRLGELGRREEALKAAEEAVETYRRLAKDRPDAFLPDLAMSLNNLGKMLSDLGRREEALKAAQEAVETYTRLAKDRPDVFLPYLAASLGNLGNMLSDLGRREEALKAAQEAVEIYRRLAKDRPDAFLPDLAASLNNLGNMLSELGRREDALKAAQEAVEIRRRLAKDRPDAFLPDLATSLNNLGPRLSDLGRREDALKATQEAVEIRRRLATDRPDAFLPNLAMSLNNLGNRLRELGRREEALKAAQEAVDIRRRLAKDRPDAFLAYLASSLNNLGASLSELGRREEALKATQEAVDIRRRLAKDRPDVFLPDLAMSLNNLGKMLSDLGRREEALKAAQEAVEIYRRLAKDRPDAFLPYLARSLGAQGTILHAATQLHDALEAFREGVQTLKDSFLKTPEAFAPLMGALLSDYISQAKELGQTPDMELLGPIAAKFEEIKESETAEKAEE